MIGGGISGGDPSVPPPAVSVVIPTFNGRERVPDVLRALLGEAGSVPFEVVVIDNASSDGTGAAVDGHPAAAALRARGVGVRVVREERAGLTHARARGVAEARGEAVCFLDDDNLPQPGYLACGVEAFADPSIGLLTSRVFPRYRAEPSPAVEKREHLLAINHKLGDQVLDWGAAPTVAPTIGAGLWVRREAFVAAQNAAQVLSDRLGGSLASGGDVELGVAIGRAGFRRMYVPCLRLWHLIPPERLETRYFCRLIYGIVRSKLAVEAVYEGRHGSAREKAAAFGRLLGATAALPALLARRDGRREALFVLVSRWAELRGPLRDRI
ncbi:MAG TPA: glycosyltransferase [Longimicrobium sp.]|nr:glycosyltransferase [Longimicrobium sp.]